MLASQLITVDVIASISVHLNINVCPKEYLRQTGDPKNMDDITKDLHRQFPNHEMFLSKGGHGYVLTMNTTLITACVIHGSCRQK